MVEENFSFGRKDIPLGAIWGGFGWNKWGEGEWKKKKEFPNQSFLICIFLYFLSLLFLTFFWPLFSHLFYFLISYTISPLYFPLLSPVFPSIFSFLFSLIFVFLLFFLYFLSPLNFPYLKSFPHLNRINFPPHHLLISKQLLIKNL